MYMLIYFLSFFFLFISIKADSKSTIGFRKTEEAIKKTDRLNRPELGFQSKKCQHCPGLLESEEVSEQKREKDLLQQCTVDLCGPAHENPRYIYFNFNKADINPETIEQFDKNIRPTIERMIQSRLDYENNGLNILKEALKNPNTNIKPEEWDKIAEHLYDVLHPATLVFNSDKEKKDFFIEKYRKFLKEYENRGEELTEDDKEKITQLNREMESDDIDVDNFVEDLNVLMRQIKIASCSKKPICREWVHNELSHEYQRIIKIREVRSTNDTINKAVKECFYTYTEMRANTLWSKIFRENLEDYKKRFLERAFSNYSQLSRQIFENYINEALKINFLLEEDVNPIFMDGIKKTYFPGLESQEPISLFQIVQTSLYTMLSWNVCMSSANTYDELFITRFDDSENAIIMGGFSLTFYEHGKQFFAHELAHAMSYLFANDQLSKNSYDEYSKLRQCATKRYKINNKVPWSGENWHHKHDKYKTEENTADLVTYQVFQDDPTLFTCALFTSYNNFHDYKLYGSKFDGYRDVRIVDPEYFSDTTDYDGSTHSETLLRVIMEAIHKRIALPESCQQVVDIYSDRINFEPCF